MVVWIPRNQIWTNECLHNRPTRQKYASIVVMNYIEFITKLFILCESDDNFSTSLGSVIGINEDRSSQRADSLETDENEVLLLCAVMCYFTGNSPHWDIWSLSTSPVPRLSVIKLYLLL